MSVDASDQPKLAELGTDLLNLTTWQLTRTIAAPFCAFAAYWIFAAWGLWIPAVLSLVVLSFVSYGSTSHDLVHRCLGLNPKVNDSLLVVLEALCLRSGHAYRVVHLNHHAVFPHEDDIEAEAAGMSFSRALLEGMAFQFRIVAWALNNKSEHRNRIIAECMVVVAFVIGSLAVLPLTIVPAVYVALMIAGSWIIPIVTSYLPHDPTASEQVRGTRLFRGRFTRIVFFDHLYHLEHHLYPNVPHQNWPRLAKRLDPWFDSIGVRPVRCLSDLKNSREDDA